MFLCSSPVLTVISLCIWNTATPTKQNWMHMDRSKRRTTPSSSLFFPFFSPHYSKCPLSLSLIWSFKQSPGIFCRKKTKTVGCALLSLISELARTRFVVWTLNKHGDTQLYSVATRGPVQHGLLVHMCETDNGKWADLFQHVYICIRVGLWGHPPLQMFS